MSTTIISRLFVRRFVLLLTMCLCANLITGCTMMAPQYSSSMQNVQKLRDSGNYSVKVGEFTSINSSGNPVGISLRGSQLLSPYNNSYSNYLAEAIKQELSLSGKLSADTDMEISGVLLKNDINAAIGTASGNIEAQFVLKKAGQKRYDQVKTVHHEWDSSFAAAIALPRAQLEYPNLVQKLLAALYADPAFLEALK